MEQRADKLEVLMEIARDLTASLAADDRYNRLLNAVTRVIPCDAACLLRLEGDDLVPLAGRGLAQEALVRRFSRRDHPRLDVILRSTDPVLFPADSPLPDPFDNLLRSDPEARLRVHACLGCRLTEGSEVVGALTADALQPQSFDGIDRHMLQMLGALAGAAMRTTSLIEASSRSQKDEAKLRASSTAAPEAPAVARFWAAALWYAGCWTRCAPSPARICRCS